MLGIIFIIFGVTALLFVIEPRKMKRFIIPNAGIVECLYVEDWAECGLTLRACNNNITYRCMTNVQQIP